MPQRYITASEYEEISDDSQRHELVRGIVLAEPFPSARHDRTRQRLEWLLLAFVESHSLGEVFGDVGYLLAHDPDTVRGPDLSFVSRDRLLAFDDTRFFEGAPELAVEILSPSNRRGTMSAKIKDYLAAGARLVWIVDTERKSVTTYRPNEAARRIESTGELDGEDVLPGLVIPLASIFER